ncbi:MAG: hypothetical protein ACODAD_11725, partial [Planctomycetota bacterium]
SLADAAHGAGHVATMSRLAKPHATRSDINVAKPFGDKRVGRGGPRRFTSCSTLASSLQVARQRYNAEGRCHGEGAFPISRRLIPSRRGNARRPAMGIDCPAGFTARDATWSPLPQPPGREATRVVL